MRFAEQISVKVGASEAENETTALAAARPCQDPGVDALQVTLNIRCTAWSNARSTGSWFLPIAYERRRHLVAA